MDAGVRRDRPDRGRAGPDFLGQRRPHFWSRSGLSYVRRTPTAGTQGRAWQDPAADLARRANTWRTVLEGAGVSGSDRALVALPLTWAAAYDAQSALIDLGALTSVCEQPSLTEVLNFAPTVFIGTLSDSLWLAHTAALQRIDVLEGPLQLAVITGEPGASLRVTRRAVEAQWGATCLDVYAVSELGVVGWNCRLRGDGLHVDDRALRLEVLEPDSECPVAEGELGELVITTPDDWGTPLSRCRTGDLVRLQSGACTCGLSSAWLEGGVLGRVDERLTLRGKQILPSMVEQVVRRHPAVVDFALRAFDGGELTVHLETTSVISTEGDQARVAAEVSQDLKRSLGLRLACEVVVPGSISAKHLPGHRAQRLTRG